MYTSLIRLFILKKFQLYDEDSYSTIMLNGMYNSALFLNRLFVYWCLAAGLTVNSHSPLDGKSLKYFRPQETLS